MTNTTPHNWWRSFFESADSLELSFFPGDKETGAQVRHLVRLLDLSTDDRIADICCGYGRHLARLAKAGYDVVGLDSSEMMLGYCRELLDHAGLASQLVRGDASGLPFPDESFDVVLNLFNSFGYFLEEGQNMRVLQETARILKPGGRFFLDTRNRQFQILYAPYCQPMTVGDDRELVLRCKYDRQTKRMRSCWSLPEEPETVVHEASIRLYGLDELDELMHKAGFERTGVYGTYSGQAYAGHHRELLYAARKRA